MAAGQGSKKARISMSNPALAWQNQTVCAKMRSNLILPDILTKQITLAKTIPPIGPVTCVEDSQKNKFRGIKFRYQLSRSAIRECDSHSRDHADQNYSLLTGSPPPGIAKTGLFDYNHCRSGEVSEMADERDLGSRGATRAGSSPAFPTRWRLDMGSWIARSQQLCQPLISIYD